jgi:hypothetical protein
LGSFSLLFIYLFIFNFFLLLFICAYKAWVISPPCPHPLPYHPLCPLPAFGSLRKEDKKADASLSSMARTYLGKESRIEQNKTNKLDHNLFFHHKRKNDL